ncbi:hypothetical protein [Sneathiella glossodoripedis]|uniref:hypothetical protein n=1 Tax=Sneathiella glossodoripedis TaxID=418853 RepID=UPI0004707AC7|nr:hypothetical protein [Sneathiella glossodoripedis]
MQIDLHILLGGAAIAVLLLVAIIRLISGAREAELNEEAVKKFFMENEPDFTIRFLSINKKSTAALIHCEENEAIFLIRAFGEKLVLQQLQNLKSVQIQADKIIISREGLAHPPLAFEFQNHDEFELWSPVFAMKEAS